MSDELKLNTKLFSRGGYMGRMDYFLNDIYIACIYLPFGIALNFGLMAQINSLSDAAYPAKLFFKSNPILAFFTFIAFTFCAILFANCAVRRMNDINGKVNNGLNTLVASLIFMGYFGVFLPLFLMLPFGFLSFIANLILLFKKGKITGALPYDYKKQFNWGAFLGTWIWGLYNKTYIPLWQLILFFTPWCLYFALICGIKGNEWAYKNKNWNDVEKFNKSQENQTAFWTVFNIIAVPIVVYALGIALIFFAFVAIKGFENAQEKMNNAQEKIALIYFEKYTVSDKEDKFYIHNKDWNALDFKGKVDLVKIAAHAAASKKENDYKKLHPNKYVYFKSTDELPKIKIYSVEDNKLLGKVKPFDKNASFTELLKESADMFQFYEAN